MGRALCWTISKEHSRDEVAKVTEIETSPRSEDYSANDKSLRAVFFFFCTPSLVFDLVTRRDLAGEEWSTGSLR